MPNKIPAFGLSAVPLPMKNRKMLPGCQPPIADAAGDTTAEAAGPISDTAGSAGSPLEVVVAAALAVPEPEPSSRRVTAKAAHANGAAAGESPPEPEPSHDNRAEPIEFTDPRGVAVITGTSAGTSSTAAAGTGATTDSTTAAGAGIGDTSPAGTPDPLPADGPGIDAGAPPDSVAMASDGEGAASEPGVSAVTGPPSELLRRGAAGPAGLSAGLCTRPRGPAPSVAADSAASDPEATEPASADPRPPARGPRAGEDFRDDDDDDDEESAELDPLDPADPVVSANAIGSEPRPDPTPRATANAPTRPTCRVLRPADLRIRSGDTRKALMAATGITLMSRNIALSGRHRQQTAPNYGRFTADCVGSAV